MRETIDMAKEAGADIGTSGRWLMTQAELDRLVALVRADEREQGQKWFDAVLEQHKIVVLAEREACAKVADGFIGGDVIAERIRNRGQA